VTSRRRPHPAALAGSLLVLAVALAACTGGSAVPLASPTSGATPATSPGETPVATPVTATPTPSLAPATSSPTPGVTPTPVPESPVTGLVIGIDRTGLTDVKGFTFRTDEGETLSIRMGRLENEAEFPPSHLAEHMAAGDVLRVYFRVEDGDLLAYRIEHADDDGDSHGH
jgi:hypothetical protein